MKKQYIFRFLIVALCAVTAFAVACTPSGNKNNNNNDSIEGIYTDTWEFRKDGKVTFNPSPYDYSVKTKTGDYSLSGKEVTITWENGGTEKLEFSNNELIGSGKTYKKINKEELYREFCGEYMTMEASWPSDKIKKIIFTENGKFTISDGNGEFYLQAITETHGIVQTSVLDVMHIGYIAMYEPLALMYYTKIGDFYHIRLSEGSHPYSDGTEHNPWAIAHNHFTDWYQRGDTFETLSVYDMLAGEGGTVENPVSTTYSNGGASLTLFNDGELKLAKGGSNRNRTFIGGKGTFVTAGVEQPVTYSFIALSLTHGKIFIDMDETPVSFNKAGAKERFVVGDYAVNGDNISISFTFNSINYSLSN